MEGEGTREGVRRKIGWMERVRRRSRRKETRRDKWMGKSRRKIRRG